MAGVKGMKWGRTKRQTKGKGQGWHGESRRHWLAKFGISTVLPDGRRLPVDRFIAMGNKSEHYQEGYEDGRFSAEVNIGEDFHEMIEAYKEDRIGEIVQELRENQTQMSGDISYDVMYDEDDKPSKTRWIKPSEYEEWEEGYYNGFYETIRLEYIHDNIMAIYDNGGRSFDRYSIIFKDGDLVGMSHNPKSPQGFNQYSGNIKEWGLKDLSHLGKETNIKDLSPEIQNAIEKRIGD